MNHYGLNKKRRGVGSIIAGVFVVLIILAGFEFMQINQQAEDNYQKTVSKMQEFDISKSQEDLKITYYKTSGGTTDGVPLKIEFKVKNNGPELINLKYASVFLDGQRIGYNQLLYEPMTLSLLPSETSSIQTLYCNDKPDDGLWLEPDEKYSIKLVTEKGNIFSLTEYDVYETITTIYDSGMSKIIGWIIPEYDSFNIANRTKDESILSDLTFKNTWYIIDNSKEGEYPIFKVTVHYFGPNNLVLDSKTALYFDSLGNDQNQFSAYMVYIDNGNIVSYTDNTYILNEYDPNQPNNYDLYFAVKIPEGDPSIKNQLIVLQSSVNIYKVTLGIFQKDGGYSQAFPLIAAEVK